MKSVFIEPDKMSNHSGGKNIPGISTGHELITTYTQSATNTYTNKRVMLINNDTMKTLSDRKYLIAISSAITLQLFLFSILFQYYVGSIILLSSFFMYSFITPFCCKLYKIVIVFGWKGEKLFDRWILFDLTCVCGCVCFHFSTLNRGLRFISVAIERASK